MRPRVSDEDSSAGHRKKHKKSSTNLRSKVERRLPPPVPLYECTCFECSQNPGTNPDTQLPGRGRWLSKKQYDEHKEIERKQGVAQFQFDSLSPPSLQLPIPQFGFLPSSNITATSSSPTAPHRVEVPQAPLTSSVVNSETEVKGLLDRIETATSVLEGRVIVFEKSPWLAKADPDLLVQHSNPSDLDQLCALDVAFPTNSAAIALQNSLSDAKQWLQAHPQRHTYPVATRLHATLLERKVLSEEIELRRLLLQEWKHQALVSRLSYSYDSTSHYLRSFITLPPIILASYLLAAVLFLLCGVSMEHCSFVLGMLRYIIALALEQSTSIMAPATKNALFHDIRTVINILEVEPPSSSYVACPRCCRLYWIDPTNRLSYPDHCINQETDQDVCGAKLKRLRKKRQGSIQLPVRVFRHQNMRNYIAHLYARHDLQDYLYSNPISNRETNHRPGSWDVWDAPALAEFMGPDGETPFIQPSGDEGRLIFSLNMDGFNPYGNKESGKKTSIGAIYMVCLNLPPTIRYNIENVYLVGVIPGPKEPSQHQINHFLKPLVDDLLALWNPGVFISRTIRRLHGFLVRCAMVPLVCDLPAARQMAGSAHYTSHNFCSICTQTLDNINDITVESFVLRDQHGHRAAAAEWYDAPTQKDRERAAKRHGVRWSELLRLPYWDPTRFVIIDSMHAFYLRLFQYHCRNIWGMNVKMDDGAALASQTSKSIPDEEVMRQASDTLRKGNKTSLMRLPVAVLRQLCKDTTTLEWRAKKPALVESLLEYRIRQGWFSELGERLEPEVQAAQPSVPVPPTNALLVNPNIQTYIVNDAIPSELRIRSIADVEDYYANADSVLMRSLVKNDLLTLFAHKVFPKLSMSIDEAKRLLVVDLRELIHDQRQIDGLLDARGRLISRAKPKKTHVLGQGVLAEIRRDMRTLQLPSWLPRPPNHPGEESWGKLSADQWRTFCIHILPVTLTRLWGGKEADSIEQRQLENFMHLVSAVKLATMRKMTEERIQKYEYHIHAYLETLLELYPDIKLTPYQHLVLHFGDFLRRFGPTQAWRCFPFERYNYVMQNLPTNGIFGELESTIFNKFYHAQRLRVLFSTQSLPEILHPVVDIFNKYFHNDSRGTRMNDTLASYGMINNDLQFDESAVDEGRLHSHALSLLRDWISRNDSLMDDQPISQIGQLHKEVCRTGVKFATAQHSSDNSHVIIDDPLSSASWRAATIQSLFTHTRIRSDGSSVTQTFALLSTYRSLQGEDRYLDHYRQFPVVGGKLYYNAVSKEQQIIDVASIQCHFGAYIFQVPGRREFLLAQPLDKE